MIASISPAPRTSLETMSDPRDKSRSISRRAILKSFGLAPLLLRAAPLRPLSLFDGIPPSPAGPDPFPLLDARLTPRYPTPSPLADIFRLVPAGSDEYILEPYAIEIEAILQAWGSGLRGSPVDHQSLAGSLDERIEASPLNSARETKVRSGQGIDVLRRRFSGETTTGKDILLKNLGAWLGQPARVATSEFEVYSVEKIASSPLTLRLDIRYDIVTVHSDDRREERVGSWRTEWTRVESRQWKARAWHADEETVCIARGPVFVDVTGQSLGAVESYREQLLHGADYWRTVLDGAIGVDVYGNNGVASGDFDNDGFDDFYVCQPAGLPNRLYRNRGDGTFEDVTEKAGVGVLDNTACALFADFRNQGHQDLLVVRGTGPLLFLNQGDGTFSLKRGAFKFARQPQGTFTHAAVADYDRDGRLDIYFCMYMYYLGLDQYHYPIPYYDARNGPPNCLFHNEGDGTFIETTEAAGMNADNDRYSFACAWGDSNANGLPDLFVANDFGSSQLYRNNGDGTFKVASKEAHVESVGAGMSCCWADFDNDGRQDIYVPSMWEAAGQRVSGQQQFHGNAPQNIRALYQRHARGNALYRNQGDGTFQNVGPTAAVEMGRWSWSSDFWDFDHDGFSDLYVANGYLSGPQTSDLAGFFWRQVVAKSSEDATPSLAYERGWNAINELVRSDNTWHGYARNVMFVNNRDGTFTEASGAVALDFIEDSRSFALADIDHDGRLEIILKNRNAPQIRVLHNAMRDIGQSISFRLRGTKSNRDAIGAAITIEAGTTRQTKYLQAGSGFLSQHSKELFFGLGDYRGVVRAVVRWPSNLSQTFEGLPANHRIELEEGSSQFDARPFSATPSVLKGPSTPPASDVLPSQVNTWLIEPLKAPEFSLPDLAGNLQSLSSVRGGVVLLNFWSTAAPPSLEQLKRFNQHSEAWPSNNVQVIAINVDDAEAAQTARSFAAQQRLSFKTLFANEETAGIYNLIYRHLFDRRRDLPIPVSFLLDREGMIVKVYQGPVDPVHLLADARSIPGDNDARMSKALPFPGLLVQDAFQRNDFTYGVAMYQHGYLDQAAASFQQVIAAKPDNADAHYNLGTLNLRRNNLAEASRNLEETVKLRPDYPEAWNNLGMMAAQQGNAEDAIRDFQRSIDLRPNYAIAYLNLGNVYRRQKNFSKAQDSLSRALALQPDDPEINYSLGMLYVQQDQMQQASQFLEHAIELRPVYPEAMNNLGVLFVRQRNYVKAEEQFNSGIRVAPNFDQSYLNLARLYALQDNRTKAREVLQQLLRLQPENAGAKQAMEMLQ
jgi:tetratricopeptide (TPR) repeat protein/peroxiredoxin